MIVKPKTSLFNTAVFFDRDGVVNKLVDRGDNCIVAGKKVRNTAPWFFGEFEVYDNVALTIEKIKKKGYLVILATNQPDLTYGTLSRVEHEKIMKVVDSLGFDAVYVCPHGRNDGCNCKKPRPGLLLQAAEKYHIDLTQSFMVGDFKNDMDAIACVGGKSILIKTDYNFEVKADYYISNISQILEIVIVN